MKSIFMFLTLVGIFHTLNSDWVDDILAKIPEQKKECLKLHYISHDVMEKLSNNELVDDPNLKKYIHCLSAKRGFLLPDGSFDTKRMKEVFQRVLKKALSPQMMSCAIHPVLSMSDVESTWKLVRCLQLKLSGADFRLLVRAFWVVKYYAMKIDNMRRDLILSTYRGPVTIGESHKTFIIAEIGQNHQGDVEIAKQLILTAKKIGADCAKFQKTNLEAKFAQCALQRAYNSPNSWGITYGEHKAFLEFSDNQFLELNAYAKEVGILFSASAMDHVSLDLLAGIQVPFIKIGSGDTNNFPLIEKAAALKPAIPLFVSTGMQTLATIDHVYDLLSKNQDMGKRFIFMHCISAYPAPLDTINLNLVHFYRQRYPDIHFGYSGHEIGIEVSALAVAAGCRVIERHLTLNNQWKGSDHICSLMPTEFAGMVEEIRKVELIMGFANKTILPCELPCREKLGKSLVAARSVGKHSVLLAEDIAVKVAHHGCISAERLPEVLGRRTKKALRKDDGIEEADIE